MEIVAPREVVELWGGGPQKVVTKGSLETHIDEQE
jgi:hypothetical protein